MSPTKEFAVDNLEIGEEFGAGNETRTRDPDLGKVVLYLSLIHISEPTRPY